MYSARVRIFAVSSLIGLMVIVARLAYLQLGANPALQDRISQLKDQRGRSQPLKTVRGKILDRLGRVVAYDEPIFKVRIRYDLSRYLDGRIQKAKRMQALKKTHADKAIAEVNQAIDANLAVLREVIGKCSRFGDPCEVIEQTIQRYNDRIWDQRAFQAWRNHCTQSDFFRQHAADMLSVKSSDALADFERNVPDPNRRLILAADVDIAEMHGSWPLVELKTDSDVLVAQLEFMDVDGIAIVPDPVRVYPYKTAAAQTIGWVGEASQEQDRELFATDPYARYLDGEVCGREDGVEYVCEAVLRGRRGKVVYDVDGTVSRRIASRLGQDVHLTIDIELQETLEEYLRNYPHAGYCGPGMAAVVLDVETGDILAMVSLPKYDLNRARYDYDHLRADPNKPLLNRALNQQYPPGSVVKPLILVAGLQTGRIRPDDVILCPSHAAPAGWPDCWIFRRNDIGHDKLWTNTARNALRGSCNIYFSTLASRIEARALQEWLFAFGYGRQVPLAYPQLDDPNNPSVSEASARKLRQMAGQISSQPLYGASEQSLDQIPPLDPHDRALLGIGEGKFLATPLQIAGGMASLARGGLYEVPRLFLPSGPRSRQPSESPDYARNLGLTEQTLETVNDGLHAVVNEENGTAHDAFRTSTLAQQGIRIYGKTGSTERPDHAWFAGFARDSGGRAIALAVVVESGQSGGGDAAPLGRDILGFCAKAGYLGR